MTNLPIQPDPYRFLRRHRAVGLAVAGCLYLTACKPATISTTTLTPAGTSALARATANVQTAQEQVAAAKPHADSTGKTYLDIATRQQQLALDEHAGIANTFSSIEKQFQQMQSDQSKLQGKYDALYRSWGATAERWIRRVFWIWLIGHVGLGIAALFIPGSAGAIVAAIAAALNPAAWFQAIRDNAYFRIIVPKASTSTPAATTA